MLHDNCPISIKNSPKFVHTSSINNMPSFVQMVIWYQSGGKPLAQPMVTQRTDAYTHGEEYFIRLLVEMSIYWLRLTFI